jgi:thioredoxin 1
MGANTKNVTDSSFENDVIQSKVPVLVDFWAEWCGPCKALGPKLDEIAGEMQGKLVVVKVNIDENPDAPSRYGVRSIPTMILFKDGKDVDQIVGNMPKDKIVAAITRHVS